jgi:hypothetical protein
MLAIERDPPIGGGQEKHIVVFDDHCLRNAADHGGLPVGQHALLPLVLCLW